ncbi:hypothetical protein [Aeromonas simiae]
MMLKTARFQVPQHYAHAGFVLRACDEAQAVREYVALLREREQLHQLFRADDPWPSAHFSLAQHEADLAWQVSEFRAHRSFAYTVWEGEEQALIGGLYLYPSLLPGVQVEVFFWLGADSPVAASTFSEVIRRWLRRRWNWTSVRFPGRDTPWVEWPGVTYPW